MNSWLLTAPVEYVFCVIPPLANQWSATLQLDTSGFTGSFLKIPTRPSEPASLSTREDLPHAVTAYLPRVGQIDLPSTPPAHDNGLADERAAAIYAARQGTQPGIALLQKVLDGLRRL